MEEANPAPSLVAGPHRVACGKIRGEEGRHGGAGQITGGGGGAAAVETRRRSESAAAAEKKRRRSRRRRRKNRESGERTLDVRQIGRAHV